MQEGAGIISCGNHSLHVDGGAGIYGRILDFSDKWSGSSGHIGALRAQAQLCSGPKS